MERSKHWFHRSPVIEAPAEVVHDFVPLSPQQLLDYYSSHSSLEARHILQAFIGRWIRVEGQAAMPQVYDDTHLLLPVYSPALGFGSALTSALFRRDEWADRLGALGMGRPVVVIGELMEIDQMDVIIGQARLESGGDSVEGI